MLSLFPLQVSLAMEGLPWATPSEAADMLWALAKLRCVYVWIGGLVVCICRCGCGSAHALLLSWCTCEGVLGVVLLGAKKVTWK